MRTKRRVRSVFNRPLAAGSRAGRAYARTVDVNDLTTEQRDQIVRALHPTAGYLTRLSERMQRKGWDPSDPVYELTWPPTRPAPAGAHAGPARLPTDLRWAPGRAI